MPNLLIKAAEATEDFLAYIGKYLIGKDMASYCDLETAIGLTEDDIKRAPDRKDPYTLVTREGSLLTVIDLQGSFEMLDEDEFETMVETMRVRMSGYMSRPGHSLTIGFERDPERALDELMRLAEPQINTARRLGLQAEDVILDRMLRNAPYVAYEQNLLVVYTHPVAMSDEERKREHKHAVKQQVAHKVPHLEFGQNPAAVLMALKFRHDTLLDRIESDFETCGIDGRAGIMLQRLSAHEAIKRVRIMVNRERTSQKYRPVLPGDRFQAHGREDSKDHSDLVPPPVAYQICTNDVDTLRGREVVCTDELWHGNLFMELGPQVLQRFASLFTSIDRDLPWRMRMDLSPGGLKEMRGRQMLTSFVGIFPSNRSIQESFTQLNARRSEDPDCSMKITFSTWAKTEHDLKRRLATLEKAIQGWGVCQVTGIRGDPLAAWASTIPGCWQRNVADRMVPPLSDAIFMMPLQRPATPWASGGSLVQRTPDGKIFPIQLASRLQDTNIELIASPPGSGKSVMGNTQNEATLFNSGNVRLPYIAIVDVGPSSKGFVDLVADALPSERAEEAVYIRLMNDRNYAVNPFDPQLGCRQPTVAKREFLVDFLSQMCVDTSDGKIPGGVAMVCSELIKLAYNDREGAKALSYEVSVEAKVDNAIAAAGLRDKYPPEWWESTTWYEVCDLLFEAGYAREAVFAHRQAVPVLPDVISYLNDASIKQVYGEARTKLGEPLLNYMYRCFTSAIANYALFSGRTRFELSSATRIVSIDLNSVIGGKTPEGYAKTTQMYMFAMHVATQNYLLDEEGLLPLVPPLYKEYHIRRIADVKDEQKTLMMDEFHNTGGGGELQQGLTENVVKLGREGRKWGIRIVLLSQYLTDYPPTLLDAATAVYVMRGGQAGDERVLKERFNIGPEPVRRLRQDARGPGPEGGNYLAIFKTKVGNIVQMLTNTVGPIALWAFSTTPGDTALRNRLYKAIGTYAARKLLAEKFPLGSASRLIEVMKQEAGGKDSDGDVSIIERLANQLLDEHAQQQRKAWEIAA